MSLCFTPSPDVPSFHMFHFARSNYGTEISWDDAGTYLCENANQEKIRTNPTPGFLPVCQYCEYGSQYVGLDAPLSDKSDEEEEDEKV